MKDEKEEKEQEKQASPKERVKSVLSGNVFNCYERVEDAIAVVGEGCDDEGH
jgi:hypothetical protein